MKNTFSTSVVVITGGASGIGRAIALQLADLNVAIVIIDRNEHLGAGLVRELMANGCAAEFLCGDVSEGETAKELFRKIEQKYQSIDYVINSAGVFMGGEMRDTPVDDARMIVANNIMAIMNGSQYAYEIMLRQQHGHIVNLGSAAGLMPMPGMGIYGATKYAVNGYTLALRNEAKALGVKVSLVCPTIVDTPLYDTAAYQQIDKSEVLSRRHKFQTPEVAARKIIKGIAKNKATIHTSYVTAGLSVLYRIAPRAYDAISRRAISKMRRKFRT